MTVTDPLVALEPEKISAPHVSSAPDQNKWWGVAKAVLWRLFTMVLGVAIVLLVWQLFLEIFGVDPFIGRGPSEVWNFLTTGPVGADARDQLWTASVTTLTDAGLGLAAGASVAVLVALFFNLSKSAESTFMPAAIVLRSVPLVAMTPLITLIFGRGLMSVTIIAGIVTFFPVLVNVSLALRSAPKAALDLCQAYGATPVTTLRKVQVPTALPALFASLRIAAPLAIIGAQLAEYLSTGKGLGYLMLQSISLSNYNMLWAATVLVTIYSIIVYSIIAAVEKIMLAKYSDPRG
ncbi:MAG TPA: ABC transporter permease [Acidimicrobiia bacterium]|jgi:ABC-type nitrate/sulfonate/bicarbonate transport system permease component